MYDRQALDAKYSHYCTLSFPQAVARAIFWGANRRAKVAAGLMLEVVLALTAARFLRACTAC